MNDAKDVFDEEATEMRAQEPREDEDAWMEELEHDINEALADGTDSDAITEWSDSDRENETEAIEPPRTTENEDEDIVETSEDEEDEGGARVGSKRPFAMVDEDSEEEATARSHQRARLSPGSSDESG
jgi:hypothetical protein